MVTDEGGARGVDPFLPYKKMEQTTNTVPMAKRLHKEIVHYGKGVHMHAWCLHCKICQYVGL